MNNSVTNANRPTSSSTKNLMSTGIESFNNHSKKIPRKFRLLRKSTLRIYKLTDKP